MRIVIDARMLGWSGIGRYSKHLLEELSKMDNSNHYLVLLGQNDFNFLDSGVGSKQQVKNNPNSLLLASIFGRKNWEPVLSPYRPYSLGEQLGLAWQLYKLKADLVHFLGFNSPVLYLKKRVVTIHDLTMIDYKNYHGGPVKRLVTWAKYWPMRFNLRCIVMRSKAIFTPTAYVKKEILRHWGKDMFYDRLKSKVHVTHEAADKLHAKGRKVTSLVGKEFLLYVGNAYPHKNLKKLIEAFRGINLQRPALRLVLVGRDDAYYQKLERQVRNQGLRGVKFLHSADDAQLVWLYQNALVFVFPSLSEGFGLPGLEAMQYGLPVAAARGNCLPEVYGDAAIYFNPHQPANMAEAITKLLDSPKLRQGLMAKATKRVSGFSWQHMATQTLDVYQKTTN